MTNYHEHGSSPVKPRPITVLPNILNPVCVPPDEPSNDVLVCSLYRLSVSLERAFSPPDCAIVRLDAYEKPAGRYTKDLT